MRFGPPLASKDRPGNVRNLCEVPAKPKAVRVRSQRAFVQARNTCVPCVGETAYAPHLLSIGTSASGQVGRAAGGCLQLAQLYGSARKPAAILDTNGKSVALYVSS